MPEPEQPKRSIDERLDALTMNVELLYRDRLEDRLQDQRRAEEQALFIRHLGESLDSLRDTVKNLVAVVSAHEDRIHRLERAS